MAHPSNKQERRTIANKKHVEYGRFPKKIQQKPVVINVNEETYFNKNLTTLQNV